MKNVLVTGGAGYVGAVLVPKLLKKGHTVSVLDWFLYGDVLRDHPHLRKIRGDIRDMGVVKEALGGIDAVIHLACISNDPSFELDPELGKSVNYDATIQLFEAAKAGGVPRFVYASSSSVYGVKKEKDVTEDLPLAPLTDYSKYKAMCEEYLLRDFSVRTGPAARVSRATLQTDRDSAFPSASVREALHGSPPSRHPMKKSDTKRMTILILRPATVCGYSPRMRLDLTVNMLAIQALVNKKITVFGGSQLRPNIHIEDMTDLYVKSLEYKNEQIHGKIYNAGYDNYTIMDIAQMVTRVIGDPNIEIVTTQTKDNRSYRVSSRKIEKELGFTATRSVEDAIRDLVSAYRRGNIPHALTDARYNNLRMMKRKNHELRITN